MKNPLGFASPEEAVRVAEVRCQSSLGGLLNHCHAEREAAYGHIAVDSRGLGFPAQFIAQMLGERPLYETVLAVRVGAGHDSSHLAGHGSDNADCAVHIKLRQIPRPQDRL